MPDDPIQFLHGHSNGSDPGKEKKWEYQVNLSMAIKICFAFLQDHVAPGNVNGLISQYILPVRPDRTYARQLRFQAPAGFAYRFV